MGSEGTSLFGSNLWAETLSNSSIGTDKPFAQRAVRPSSQIRGLKGRQPPERPCWSANSERRAADGVAASASHFLQKYLYSADIQSGGVRTQNRGPFAFAFSQSLRRTGVRARGGIIKSGHHFARGLRPSCRASRDRRGANRSGVVEPEQRRALSTSSRRRPATIVRSVDRSR